METGIGQTALAAVRARIDLEAERFGAWWDRTDPSERRLLATNAGLGYVASWMWAAISATHQQRIRTRAADLRSYLDGLFAGVEEGACHGHA